MKTGDEIKRYSFFQFSKHDDEKTNWNNRFVVRMEMLQRILYINDVHSMNCSLWENNHNNREQKFNASLDEEHLKVLRRPSLSSTCKTDR